MSTFTPAWFEDESPRDLARWVAAGLVVAALHAGVVAYFLTAPPSQEIGDEADAVTVELAPIDSTPDAVARDVAPAPESMIESKAVPEPQKVEREKQTKVEAPPDQAPAIVPLPTEKAPEKVEQPRPPAPRTAEQVKGGAPHVDPSWQTSVMRQLQRLKRYPPEAQSHNEQGIVLLSFSLDRSGHVLARHIAKSSGYPDLDQEVLAMIMRADPLPPFPERMPQPRLDLTVPVRFSLH